MSSGCNFRLCLRCSGTDRLFCTVSFSLVTCINGNNFVFGTSTCCRAGCLTSCLLYTSLWSMSVDSRYSGSDLPGESTKTTIPDDYGAHIVRFGLFYRHGKLSGAFMGWTQHQRCCVQCDHECPVTGNVYPYYLYRKTGICGRSEIRGYR